MNTRTFIPTRAQQRPFQEEDGTAREQGRGFENAGHTSVMVRECVEALALKKGDVVLDATAGLGGHSEALLSSADVTVISLDADSRAVAASKARLSKFGERSVVLNANFADLTQTLAARGITTIDKALFDLGWNRTQLVGRGFSFLRNEPLHMGYSDTPRSGFTAAQVVNEWGEEVLADVFFGYGEERYARRIAKKIVEARKEKAIQTTGQLVEIISSAVPAPYRKGRLHFATRTFQALRIAVNDELGAIDSGVRAAWELLTCDGAIAVISFHSIEDRRVKHLFAEFAKGDGRLVYKKPLTPSSEEISQNPSARSAKVRAITKPCLDA